MPFEPGGPPGPGRPRDLGRELQRLTAQAATIRGMMTERQSLAHVLRGGLNRTEAQIIADQAHMIADLSKQLRQMYLGELPVAADIRTVTSSEERDAALVAIGAFLDRACGHGEVAS